MLSVRKAAVLGLVATLAVVVGTLRLGVPAERSEAYFATPGGIAALPAFMPSLIVPAAPSSGISQLLPAVAPASGPGSFAIVTAMCFDDAANGWLNSECPGLRGVSEQRLPPQPTVTFTMSKMYPMGAPVAATFTANGGQTLVCTDDHTCDLTDGGVGREAYGVQHVAVGLTGGGENEVINVTGCYEPDVGVYPGPVPGERDCRTVQVAFVETILIVPPFEAASGAGPALASYRCDDVGLYTAPGVDPTNGIPAIQPGGTPFATPQVSWEEVFDWFFAPGGQAFPTAMLRRPTSQLPLPDIPFYSCGWDTPSTADDRVTFETDNGIFTVDWMADFGAIVSPLPVPNAVFRPWGTISPACDVGDSVDIQDSPGPVVSNNAVRGGFNMPPPLPMVPSNFCDLDFAPNGVVTYALSGSGQAGVATVTAQQSGVGPLRSSNVSFMGLPALSLMMETPDVIGLEGGDFSAVVVDADFRFLQGVNVECSAEPKEAVLAIVPQTGATGAFPEPFASFTLFPTRSAVETGVDVTVTCFVDENPDVKASATVRIGKPVEDVDLVAGCNPFTSTWPDGTPIETVAEAVSPGDALDAIWALDAESGAWQGYAPDAPEASDLESVDELDAIFACMSEAGTISRPEI